MKSAEEQIVKQAGQTSSPIQVEAEASLLFSLSVFVWEASRVGLSPY